MQDHAGAAAWSGIERCRRDRKRALAGGGPLPRFLAPGMTGEHVDAIGDHERRVEADAELADQRRAFPALRRFDAIEERLGPRMRDGSEPLHHVLAAHADAVV